MWKVGGLKIETAASQRIIYQYDTEIGENMHFL